MRTCLVVDDSSVIRKVARRILESLEFEITEAADGAEALDKCIQKLPDAVLVAWNMPNMDGLEFLRALRKLPGGDRPKVVFCTTENDVGHIASALHAGADEYIMKPFDRDIVAEKFQRVGFHKSGRDPASVIDMTCGVPAIPAAAHQPVRVMVVDDSVVIRDLLSRWLEAEPGIEVAAALRTGREAVDAFPRHRPDVVLLDIEMPVLDGLAALPLLLAMDRDLVVIMASSLTRHHAEASLKALALGAADYISKPQARWGENAAADFRRELVAKVKSLGARRGTRSPRRDGVVHPAAAGIGAVGATAPVPPRAPAPITLRPFATVVPQAVLVGASTGGPRALNALVAGLAPVIGRAAVLIGQHMPPTFTAILAEHLARAAGRPAAEAVDGEPVVPGRIYLAPGGLHMRIEHADHAARISLDDRPPVHFCRPAVDPLFSSAASAFGPAVVAVILTGMGADGALGAADIAAAGGSVIAQDETTSVVWGMPGAAAHAGLCSAVLPLGDIAPRVVRLFAGGRG